MWVGLGRNASGGTSPRLSWGRSVLQHGSPSAVMAPDRHQRAEEMNAEDFGALGLAVGLVGALDERLLHRLSELDKGGGGEAKVGIRANHSSSE